MLNSFSRLIRLIFAVQLEFRPVSEIHGCWLSTLLSFFCTPRLTYQVSNSVTATSNTSQVITVKSSTDIFPDGKYHTQNREIRTESVFLFTSIMSQSLEPGSSLLAMGTWRCNESALWSSHDHLLSVRSQIGEDLVEVSTRTLQDTVMSSRSHEDWIGLQVDDHPFKIMFLNAALKSRSSMVASICILTIGTVTTRRLDNWNVECRLWTESTNLIISIHICAYAAGLAI